MEVGKVLFKIFDPAVWYRHHESEQIPASVLEQSLRDLLLGQVFPPLCMEIQEASKEGPGWPGH